MAGGKQARTEDRRDVRAGRRPRQAVGRDLPRGLRGGRDRDGRRAAVLRPRDDGLRADHDQAHGREPGHSLPGHLLRGLRPPALRTGVPAGLPGADHLLHRRLLSEDHREDVGGVHGRLHLPVPGLRRPGAERRGGEFRQPERVLRRIRQSFRGVRMERRFLGIRFDHGSLGGRGDQGRQRRTGGRPRRR